MEGTAFQVRHPTGLGGVVVGRQWEGELGSSSDMGIIVWRQQGRDNNRNESTSDSKHVREEKVGNRAKGLPTTRGQRRERSQEDRRTRKMARQKE